MFQTASDLNVRFEELSSQIKKLRCDLRVLEEAFLSECGVRAELWYEQNDCFPAHECYCGCESGCSNISVMSPQKRVRFSDFDDVPLN